MEKNKQGPTGEEKQAIYVAKVNINTGDPINPDMVMLKEWPKADIPSGALTELADVEDRRPRTPIFQGEPILDSKLLNPGEKAADPTQYITKGYRIVPISVRADTGAAGLLRPGDRVDVQWYVSRNPQLGVPETVTKTILHNVRVFAIDQTVIRPATADEQPTLAKTISLLLDPIDANKIQLASKLGEVSLIPRNPDDPSAEDASRVTFRDLIDESGKGSREAEQGRDGSDEPEQPGLFSGLVSKLSAGAAAAAAMQTARPPFEMEVVRGDEVELEKFDALTGKPLRELTQVSTTTYGGRVRGFGTPSRDFDDDENPMTIPTPTSEDNKSEPGTFPLPESPEDEALEFPIDLGEGLEAA
jgi:pilus assembly protein CpaB